MIVQPGDGGAPAISAIVKEQIKRARRKDEKRRDNDGLEQLSELAALNAITSSQAALFQVLAAPPLSPATGVPITRVPTTYNADAQTLLGWNTNANRVNAWATYNAITGIRAEMLIHFLDHGLGSKRHGMFSGGVRGLVVLSALNQGGGFGGAGLFNLFGSGGQVLTPITPWGGVTVPLG